MADGAIAILTNNRRRNFDGWPMHSSAQKLASRAFHKFQVTTRIERTREVDVSPDECVGVRPATQLWIGNFYHKTRQVLNAPVAVEMVERTSRPWTVLAVVACGKVSCGDFI
jgi:hypothetical protein